MPQQREAPQNTASTDSADRDRARMERMSPDELQQTLWTELRGPEHVAARKIGERLLAKKIGEKTDMPPSGTEAYFLATGITYSAEKINKEIADIERLISAHPSLAQDPLFVAKLAGYRQALQQKANAPASVAEPAGPETPQPENGTAEYYEKKLEGLTTAALFDLIRDRRDTQLVFERRGMRRMLPALELEIQTAKKLIAKHESGQKKEPAAFHPEVTGTIPDPQLAKRDQGFSHQGERKATFATVENSQLVINGASAEDVKQGGLGTCYLLATLGSIASSRPGMLEQMIKDNGNGTVTVTFYAEQLDSAERKRVPVTVDLDLPVATKASGLPVQPGQLIYTRAAKDEGSGKSEIWAPMMEKAYAAFKKGGFQGVSGGQASEVMKELLGNEAQQRLRASDGDAIVAALGTPEGKQRVAVAESNTSMPQTTPAAPFSANHMYSVLGVDAGQRVIRLRDPHGEALDGRGPLPEGVGAEGTHWLIRLDVLPRYFLAITVHGA